MTNKRETIKKIEELLEEARILSVKEPMFLSDRIELNGLIREAKNFLSELKALEPKVMSEEDISITMQKWYLNNR